MESTEAPARCQVCFVVSFPAEERRRMIKCIKCNQFAHAYCYLPSCKTSFFTCEPCEKGSKEERCVICEQTGLLKRVGERFAHPACMLFNASFLVRTFRDLSFLQIEPLRPKVKLQCAECGVTNGYVMNCGLKCASACHAYCAFKSNQRAETEGSWRPCFGVSHGASNFSELFETMIFKGLSYQHSKSLKSLLSLGKHSKKAAATTLQLYCRDHSATIIECRCNEVDSEKDRWIYCDCCCIWQHTECLENQQEAEEAISDENQKFFCLECKVWTKMTLETHLDIPQSLPKLQLYDFVFVHLYLEANKFEVSLPLQEFVFKLPVFPGKEYVELVYRKKVASVLLDKISLEAQLKSLLNAKGSSEAGLTEGLVKILDQSRDKLLLTWILCRENLLQTNEARVAEFSKKFGKQLFKENNLKTMVELIIDFDAKFKNGNFREIRQIQSLLDGSPQTPKRENESRQRLSKSIKVEKPLLALNDKLRKLIAMGRENNSRETILDILGQVHGLVNSPQIMPFHKDLPKIPIVYASILLKDKDAAIRYVVVVTHLQYLRGEWEKLTGNSKCQDRQAFTEKKKRMLADAEKYYDRHILEEENDKLKEELMREWARNEVSNLIPSREIALTEPTQIIANINFNNLSLRKVSESLEKYTQEFLASSHKKEGFAHIKELTIMQRFLNQLETLKFTKKSLFKIKELSRQNWSGEYMDFIPKILADFGRLYQATEKILREELYRNIREQVCLFQQWKQAELQGLFDDESVERYLTYFKDIEGVKIHRFSKEVHSTIKGKFLVLVDRLEEKSHFFRDEEEYKLISKWCTTLKIVPKKMGEIFKKDKDFQQAFLFLKPQFDNIEATQKLDALVTEHFHYCKDKEIQFRVHQLQVLLTWVDLHKAILNKVPANLLLDEEQAQCFESQVKGKPDYYVLKQLWNIMKQAKFPNCPFQDRFQLIVQDGEKHCQNINSVFERCSWGYDLSASLDWDRKMEKDEFQKILRSIRECGFYFQAEIIQLEIIRDKFQDAERQSQMLKVESEKRAERDYLQGKARSLLVLFGCFPITSKWSKYLWGLLENQKIPGLPENLQAYIQDIQKSKRMHSWQQLDNLREVIDCKLEGKYHKKNYCDKLANLVATNRQLNSRCKPLIEKYSYKSLFSEAEMEGIKRIVSEYQDMQFQDEEIVMLQLKHEHYLAVKAQMKWRQNFKTNDIKTLKFLEHTVSTLHASFFTPEVEKYLAFISDQLRRAEEEKRIEEINYFNNLGRQSNVHMQRNNNSSSPRHNLPSHPNPNTNSRKDKRNERNSPINAAKPRASNRREKQY